MNAEIMVIIGIACIIAGLILLLYVLISGGKRRTKMIKNIRETYM